MKELILNLNSEYFDQINGGVKEYEYRLYNKYWKKRLQDGDKYKKFKNIIIRKGYPKKGDKERELTRPFIETKITTIKHKHFGVDPVIVFAIKVN